MKTKTIPPMHPGQMIKEDFLGDYGLTQYALAKALNIPQSRLTELIKGRRSITADTAVRLGKFFGNSPGFIGCAGTAVSFPLWRKLLVSIPTIDFYAPLQSLPDERKTRIVLGASARVAF